MESNIGILYFSDKEYKIVKKNVIMKRFISFFSKDKQMISTRRILESRNMYVKVKNSNIVKYIGYVGDLEVENNILDELVLCNWNLKINNLFNSICSIDLTNNRIDLRDREIYSIDPNGSIDIDDAIHCKELDNNITEIGIHISDPTSYIEYDSIIDNELSKRCETVYLNRKIYHMIDSEFIKNYLSLIKNLDKRSYSLIIKIKNKEIISYNFIKSIINVRDNLTYDNVNIVIYNKFRYYAEILKDIFIPTHDTAIFDSHKIIEIFMIVANHLSAKQICKYDYALIRSQESSINKENNSSKLYNIYTQFLSNKAEYKLYNINENNSHKLLNLSLYTHFTSPIRRYADMIVHRLLYNNQKWNSDKIIYNLNFNKRYYKTIVNNEILLDIFVKMPTDMIELDGYIIYININKCGIFCEKINKIFITKVIHKKLEKIIKIEYHNNKIIIGNYILKLFDKITLILCKNLYGMNKIKTYIKDIKL